MTSPNYAKQNYVFLYRGLLIVRDAMLEYIVSHLKRHHGNDWWTQGVEPAFRAEDMERLKQQFQRRYDSPDGPARPGTELYEILDINYFTNIIEYNWKKVFSRLLNNDRTLLIYIREVVAFRNPVAHTESGDMRYDDAFRGIDTSDRLLRLVNRNAAEQIARIKDEMRQAWIYDAIGFRPATPERLGVSIEAGFERLEEAIQAGDESTHDLLLFQELKEGIASLGDPSGTEGRNEAFELLQNLSRKYLGSDFAAACSVTSPLPGFTQEEVNRKTMSIRREVDTLTKQIQSLERDLDFQTNIGLRERQFVQERIELKKKFLHARQNDLERVQNELSAPAFFSVTRIAQTSVQEETSLEVRVEIRNLGRKRTLVQYEEGFSADVQLVSGQVKHEVEIEPNIAFSFSYTCQCMRAGSHSLFTRQLDYEEKQSTWDSINDTTLLALPGDGPHLTGKRLYQLTREGIELVIRLENVGDKTARAVKLHEKIRTKGGDKMRLDFEGEIRPRANEPVRCVAKMANLSELEFPRTTHVAYSDNDGRKFSLDLTDDFSQLDYPFPPVTAVYGRERELESAERVLKLAARQATEGQLIAERRILLIEGAAGIGKSRFAQEVARLARETYGFRFHTEDVINRSPVKRILRSMLGFDPGFVTRDQIWDKLNAIGQEVDGLSRYRGVLARYLSSDFEKVDETEVQDLVTGTLLFIRHLGGQAGCFLLFENAHEPFDGLERTLFQRILRYIAESHDLRLPVCVTYRPREGYPDALLGPELKASRAEKIVLRPLPRADADQLIDTLIPYPVLDEELRKFAFEWSEGNPFYIREVLRHLVSSEKEYLQRIGDGWYPSRTFAEGGFTRQISTLLLQRAKEDAGEAFPLVQHLSIVGMELPYRLLVPFFAANKFQPLTERELLPVLEKLSRAGILKQFKTGSSAELEYRFEHQLIRDAIYEDIKETAEHALIREQLFEIVTARDKEKIYPDREEFLRQAARHLLYAGRESQYTHREYLVLAADVEEAAQNFIRALEYYDALLACSTNRENYIEQAEALVGSAGILKLQGKTKPALDRLTLANDLLARETGKETKQRVADLKPKSLAEQGFLYIREKNFLSANQCLSRARLTYEGYLRSLRHIRFLLPRQKDYIEDLAKIYLGLAEIWYRRLDTTVTSDWSLKGPLLSFGWNYSPVYFKRAETLARRYSDFFMDDSLTLHVLVREGEIRSTSERDLALRKLLGAVETMKKKALAGKADEYSMEQAMLHLAELYRERGELETAGTYYKEAMQIQEKLQDIYGLALASGGLGSLYLKQGNVQEAERYLQEAYEHQSLVGDSDHLWRTCLSLSRIHMQAGRTDRAREYWLEARAPVIDRLHEIGPQKMEEIAGHLFALAKKYFHAGDPAAALPLCLDYKLIGRDDRQLVEVDEMLGKLYYRMKDPEKAIQVLYEGLDSAEDPLKRADIHSLIAEIGSSVEDGRFKERAEASYEESVRIFVENKLDKEALQTYDKLLRYISTHKDTDRLSPLLHSLIELMFQGHRKVNLQFIERAETIFAGYGLFKEAGDAFMHLALKSAQQAVAGLSVYNTPQQEAILYREEFVLLEKAEGYYARCGSVDERIGGYYKLISVYFRMNQWSQIARMYKVILITCVALRESQILIDTLNNITRLGGKFSLPDMKEMIRVVEGAQKTFEQRVEEYSSETKFRLMLTMAKLINNTSDLVTDPTEKNEYILKSLKLYDTVIEQSNNSDMIGVSCNDSSALLLSLFQVEEAEKRQIKAVEMARAANEKVSEARRRANYAVFLQMRGRLAEAQAEYEESLNVLLGLNRYWDERRRNIDASPLSRGEETSLHYDKGWCAAVAEEYGVFLYFKEHEKALGLLDLARDLYTEVADQEKLQRLEKTVESLQKRMAALPGGVVISQPHIPSPIGPYSPRSYMTCASCAHSYSTEKTRCPNCGERTCPKCGTLAEDENETCAICDQWLGK